MTRNRQKYMVQLSEAMAAGDADKTSKISDKLIRTQLDYWTTPAGQDELTQQASAAMDGNPAGASAIRHRARVAARMGKWRDAAVARCSQVPESVPEQDHRRLREAEDDLIYARAELAMVEQAPDRVGSHPASTHEQRLQQRYKEAREAVGAARAVIDSGLRNPQQAAAAAVQARAEHQRRMNHFELHQAFPPPMGGATFSRAKFTEQMTESAGGVFVGRRGRVTLTGPDKQPHTVVGSFRVDGQQSRVELVCDDPAAGTVVLADPSFSKGSNSKLLQVAVDFDVSMGMTRSPVQTARARAAVYKRVSQENDEAMTALAQFRNTPQDDPKLQQAIKRLEASDAQTKRAREAARDLSDLKLRPLPPKPADDDHAGQVQWAAIRAQRVFAGRDDSVSYSEATKDWWAAIDRAERAGAPVDIRFLPVHEM